MPKGKKNEHFWTYQGWDEELQVEYSYCPLCEKYRSSGKDGYHIIPRIRYLNRMYAGKIVIR